MEENILNDFLLRQQMDSVREVEQMKQHPYSLQQEKAQIAKLHSQSQHGTRETKENNLSKNG